MDAKQFLKAILEHSYLEKVSDIHIISNSKVIMRNKSWEIEEKNILKIWQDNTKTDIFIPWILWKDLVKNLIIELVWYVWMDKLMENFEIDSSYDFEWKQRYRINCYIDSNWFCIALRLISNEIPSLDTLWFKENIKELLSKWKWLLLVTWPTGSWKSTNLASMIDYINSNFKKHIITIEDPIEFAFKNKKSLINQRQVWIHTSSFAKAIKWALREDPDVIMIWEMRDPETIARALTLAETGHLVLSTLHTNDSVQTVDRIIDVFPPSKQDQIRMQLAMSLIWVISQRLLPLKDKPWKIPRREILIVNDAVRNLIITWKTHQLYSVLEVGTKNWMVLMDKYLIALYNKWLITRDVLMSQIRDKEWALIIIWE